ncbi:hypothetical protein K9U39_10625 [Rhodoblastus acidophilus]|uniref:Uncharacterized protein n=1 Tax=Candidatus Rhodoblastus alkanivorans TaxID=2954117 RepID=A0ABS9Z9F4_9HYPH|nr:hypothetical protein [Candidatus Rhodoblastus alkanivorans]MCI4679307.1 hypothetical protein [Candidatus Rhodoblastus alkanivorans]MCI4684066.1 hypothetical protein [Candidatus Rhodoblastus alkanivorans]MDI4641386.1 hypothetical protein [Rhodoblastus acidophilus]
MRRLGLACAATALFVAPLAARAQSDDRFCSGVDFANTPSLVIGRIKADAGKVNFRKNGDKKNACPSAAAACQEKAYLVPGDLVAVGAKRGEFTCVAYDNGKGDRGGWLPSSAIEPAPVETSPESWTGHWKRVEADITIENAKNGLQAQGEATFGALDPERVKRGAVNLGSFSGPLVLKNGQGTVVDSDSVSGCDLRMVRAGAFLFVRDNMQCGGMNVSFSGMYRKAGN